MFWMLVVIMWLLVRWRGRRLLYKDWDTSEIFPFNLINLFFAKKINQKCMYFC